MSSPDQPAVAQADIITDSAQNPAEALAATIAREYPGLRKTVAYHVLAAGLARDPGHVEEIGDEVLAEAVTRAMERADQWKPDTSPRPWIVTFADYIVKERQRQAGLDRRRRVRSSTAAEAETDPLDSLVDPTTVGPDRLFELLDLVGEPERTILRRAYHDREPQADIARSLRINEGTLRLRLLRARQRFTIAYRTAERGEKGGQR